ncbi:hypothetical protein LTR37_006423 [Vermiconidia calcicola]|uniref:Uncharacterized protein n=1 Tax=Vermiconidia calcicola TaxID=1690605 RepID=A0ACC3NH77_9PEZI|nr:hypothetical protein LTR37_006423 [Vermiconidia calcicola]
MSSVGSDAKISGAKIDPLHSETKENVPRAESEGGVAGSDRNIDQARENPLGSQGVGKHPEPHDDNQGAVGRDATISGAKIDPLVGQAQAAGQPVTGSTTEEVDATRIQPLGGVREDK